MVKKPIGANTSITLDWLVSGILTKVGDILDRLTGRRWKPSSSLATSELVERLKALLDREKRTDRGCVFVPHNIRLKMQWDKFSTDSDDSIRKLENELLAAAVDHINDKRYFTYAPLSLEAKPDYFTPGVRILASFDKFSPDEHEAAIDVSVPGTPASQTSSVPIEMPLPETVFLASYVIDGRERSVRIRMPERKRLSVGRTKENDLVIDDPSVSKIHASLILNADGSLLVADTGSTNGTFARGERIAYGKTAVVGDGVSVKFGAIEVRFNVANTEISGAASAEPALTEAFKPAGDLEFTVRVDTIRSAKGTDLSPVEDIPAPTEPAIVVDEKPTEADAT